MQYYFFITFVLIANQFISGLGYLRGNKQRKLFLCLTTLRLVVVTLVLVKCFQNNSSTTLFLYSLVLYIVLVILEFVVARKKL